MRSLFAMIFVMILVVFAVAIIPPESEAKTIPTTEITSCAYARYSPGFAIACFWEIYLALGGGYEDWGDGPSNSTYIGDGDDVTGSPGDAVGASEKPGDGDDITGHRGNDDSG